MLASEPAHLLILGSQLLLSGKGRVFNKQAYIPFFLFNIPWHDVGSKDFTHLKSHSCPGISDFSLANTRSIHLITASPIMREAPPSENDFQIPGRLTSQCLADPVTANFSMSRVIIGSVLSFHLGPPQGGLGRWRWAGLSFLSCHLVAISL